MAVPGGHKDREGRDTCRLGQDTSAAGLPQGSSGDAPCSLPAPAHTLKARKPRIISKEFPFFLVRPDDARRPGRVIPTGEKVVGGLL